MALILEEERIILDAVSSYGALLESQLIQYLKHKNEDVSSRIIAGLKKRNFLFSKGDGYVSVDLKTKPDRKSVMAFWVLLQYIPYLDYKEHYPGYYPSQIYFISNKKEYEIIVLDAGEEHLLNLYKQQNYDNSKTAIIVLPDTKMINDLPEVSFPVIYAVVNPGEKVKVDFYDLKEDKL